ncbi:metallophosphoesterase [Congregibacter variabilis]|uniref:Metallophosphoesterase n=1 Tax=Congregibacter variabilis TaxID=3081200 RepID=A0ABZ0I258_9GAMM|nr:metallophosphoesterase [Congregibacter sp. IMCC43200]
MPRRFRHVLAVGFLILAGASALAEQSDWQGVDRVVAVADLHGDYESYITVLEQAGVVNSRGRWAAGSTHLVQLGDIPDRGPDTAKIIRHLRKLETQAEKAGGKVHPLIGNHEVMNMTGDLRYVHPGEYDALKTRKSSRLQDDYYQRVVAFLSGQENPVQIDEAFREQWLKEHPLGYVEHRQYWHPQGEFGAWVSSHNTVIRINRSLFVHAGISPAYVDRAMQDINDAVRAELLVPGAKGPKIIDDELGPLWYRGLAMGDETQDVAEQLETLLQRFDVDRIVVGHTPGYGTVVPRYDARVIAADSGLAQHYGGHLASVLIEDGKVYTVQRGQRVPQPSSDTGLLDYYRAINEIEPDVNNLLYRIKQLEAAVSAE